MRCRQAIAASYGGTAPPPPTIDPWVTVRGINTSASVARCTEWNITGLRYGISTSWPAGSATGNSVMTPTINFTAIDNFLNNSPDWIHINVDPHTFPGCTYGLGTTHADNPFFHVPNLQQQAVLWWRLVGQHFAGRWHGRVSFDVLNEPNFPTQLSTSQGPGTNYPQPGWPFPVLFTAATAVVPTNWWTNLFARWDALGWARPTVAPVYAAGGRDPRSFQGFIQDCAAAIRENDTHHAITYGQVYAGGTHPTTGNPPGTGISMGSGGDRQSTQAARFQFILDDPNPVWSQHFYFRSTANGYSFDETGTTNPPTDAEMNAMIATTAAFKAANPTLPVFISEFGAHFNCKLVHEFARDMIAKFEAAGFDGWLWHTWNDNPPATGLFNAANNPTLQTALKTYGFDLNNTQAPVARYDLRATLPAGVTAAAALGSTYSKTAVGVTVASTDLDPPAFTIADATLSAQTSGNKWLVMRSSVSAGKYGGLYFGATSADQEYTFPIRGDGQMHTTNVWLGDYFVIPRTQSDVDSNPDPATNAANKPANPYKLIRHPTHVTAAGMATPLTVMPTMDSGASAVVEWIDISDAPQGPACLVVEHVGPARAMNRVNVANRWGIRLKNIGGVTATGITLAFSAAAGITAGNVGAAEAIPPDEDRTIFFDVTSNTSGAFSSVTVTATCVQGDSITDTGRAWIYPAASGHTAGQVPTPVPITKPYLIGVWDFPGWAGLNQMPSIVSSFERRPELGYLDQTQRAISDWQILWLANHGVDYLMVEWIDGNGLCPPYLAALDSSPYKDAIKFQLSFINNDGALSSTAPNGFTLPTGAGAPGAGVGVDNSFYFDTSTTRLYGPKTSGAWSGYLQMPDATPAAYIQCANFLDLIRRWKVYFARSNYLKTTDNRPRVNLFKAVDFYDAVNASSGYSAGGDAHMANVLARASAIAGAPGISWDGEIPANQGGTASAPSTRYSAAGFQRSTTYGWGSFPGASPYNVVSAARARTYGEATVWTQQRQNGTITPCLGTIGGFNHRRWLETRNPRWIVQGFEYEDFLAHLTAAKAFLDANVTAGSREVLVCSLNEYGEGSHVAPSGRTQFLWLKAIREVFAGGTASNAIVPSDVGLTIPHTPFVHRWAAMPTAYPIEDGNTNTTQGVTIP